MRRTLLNKTYYVLCHNDDWLTANWVAYPLTVADLEGTAERTEDFRADPDLPPENRAEVEDYELTTGFDRGHLAPAGDFTRSEEAMSETFVLSNVAPQVADFNRGSWLDIEKGVRRAIRAEGRGWVVTGTVNVGLDGLPTEAPSARIGPNRRLGLPNTFYKLLLLLRSDGYLVTYAWGASNSTGGVFRRMSVDELAVYTQLDFFHGLEIASRLRSKRRFIHSPTDASTPRVFAT